MSNAFNPEGEVEIVKVGGHDLQIRTHKFKTLKLIIRLITKSIKDISVIDDKSDLGDVAISFFTKNMEMLNLLFPKDTHPFMSEEFVDENFTIPIAEYILLRTLEINDLGKMFPKVVNGLKGDKSLTPKKAGV